jgi:Domain of unknown function (DUF1929)
VALLGLGAPAALAHPDSTEEHIEQDSVSLSADEERRLARETKAADAPEARAAAVQAAAVGNEHLIGQWSGLQDWPVVGIHVALLTNGKVLAYDSINDEPSEHSEVHNTTRATVWDPGTGTFTPANVMTGYNVFCSGLAHLPDGSLFLAGGNKNNVLDGIRETHVFDANGNRWTLGPKMQLERWYPSVTPLANGEMLITDGKVHGGEADDQPEVRTTSGALRTLTGATKDLPLYPWMDVAPDGRVMYTGPANDLQALDTRGQGSWQHFGPRDGVWRDYGSRALYDVGKILVTGGDIPATANSAVVDINGARPGVTATQSMANPRRQHNATVLADGTVLATGGLSSAEPLVDMAAGVYDAELWNPATGAWTTMAAESATRQYHSAALLLPDGRVLSSGGGVCLRCHEVGYLEKNAQVFSPPYLFRKDGSGQLAPRPSITSIPSAVGQGADFTIATPNAASIRKVALVRVAAATHSVNMEQRYIPLAFRAGSGSLVATAPASVNIAPPGYYMLFVIDSNGVPSVSSMVRFSAGAVSTGSAVPAGRGVPAPPARPSAMARLRTAVASDAAAARRRLAKRGLRRLLTRGITFKGRAAEAGKITYTLAAKRPQRVTIARVGKRVRAGAYSLKLRPSRRARARLAGLARVRVKLTVSFTGNSGRSMRRYQSLTLRR